jgi:hypothetical protein
MTDEGRGLNLTPCPKGIEECASERGTRTVQASKVAQAVPSASQQLPFQHP